MAATVEAICNSALIKIGAAVIVSITDTNKRAQLCNEQYTKLRDDLMRSHPWNFARARKLLVADAFTFVDGDVITGADTITEIAHARETGNKCRLTTTGVLPAGLELNTDYFIIFVDANTIQLAATAVDASTGTAIDITAAAGGGTHTLTVKPEFGYDNQYVLPAGYMRSINLNEKEDLFTVEANLLLTNEEQVELRYIRNITDVTKFDVNFDELLALMIANELSYPLVQSASLKERIQAELTIKLRDIRSYNGQEGNDKEFEANTWTNARF